MSTYLVHYSIAQQHAAATMDEWHADRRAGTHQRRPRRSATPAANGRVWERTRTWFTQFAIVPMPVIAR